MPYLIRTLAAFGTLLLVASAARAVELRPGDIVAINSSSARESLFRIDPETGAQELIASGATLRGGFGVAIDARDHILVTVGAGVLQVDPVTGASRDDAERSPEQAARAHDSTSRRSIRRAWPSAGTAPRRCGRGRSATWTETVSSTSCCSSGSPRPGSGRATPKFV
jgi:hypothetical protein